MQTQVYSPKRIHVAEKKGQGDPLNILLILALGVDLLTPYLIWKGFLPAQIRWISHGAVALMLFGALSRMIVFNHIPRAFWMILGISAFWSYIALMRGQAILATGWGLWLFFQFPFVALFIYLQLKPTNRVGGYLRKSSLLILFLLVVTQLLQYAAGQKPGDNLAGLFGRNGTGNAVLFIILVNCLFLGYWIINKRWQALVATLVMGVISSVLGEVKFYPFILAALSVIGIFLFAARSRSLGQLLRYTVIAILVLTAFMLLYNTLVPSSRRRPIQAFITDPQMLNDYLNQSQVVLKDGNYTTMVGRNLALSIGWDSLVKDPITLLFGYGIGARSESQSLQTTGISLSSGDTLTTVGTSLLVVMQEMGLIGLTIFGGFYIWIILAMARDIHRHPDSPAVELRYAILLFSLFWPIWLWYSTVWTMRVPMLLYWLTLGYVMAESRQPFSNPQGIYIEKQG